MPTDLLSEPLIWTIMGVVLSVVLIFLAKISIKRKMGQQLTIGKKTYTSEEVKIIYQVLNFAALLILVFGLLVPLLTGCDMTRGHATGSDRGHSSLFFKPSSCQYGPGVVPRSYDDGVVIVLAIPFIFYAVSIIRKAKKII